ncbi:AtpZ/AtpI family protein [Paenibacillus sp. sptzw28]|uniref:AtpZ/AtpI family protein n=1 Tax=Paenibacillus sp. sptzw28 TaxID=715179 RepID=UPI001C6DF346|nr:AtpZ/AtpI family protein [Paenibacillus sp. sptzw28]QYR22050.1 AtpZ/AtpI family protein [Paenibacillus sp. sptzw28]
MNKKGMGDNPWRAAGLVGAMGLNFAICIFLGYFVGNLIGESQGWIIGGVLVGLAAGILSCVLLVKVVLEDTDE